MAKKKSAKSAAPDKATPIKKAKKRKVEQYDHPEAERLNNPPVGLVTPESEPLQSANKTYEYDPHLDPQLVWAGKAEHTSFQVPTVSLHVHERIDPRTIIEAVKAKNGNGHHTQRGLFDDSEDHVDRLASHAARQPKRSIPMLANRDNVWTSWTRCRVEKHGG